jgi:hypothetical protein
MHRKLAALLLAFACGAGVAGCGKGAPVARNDSQVESALADLNSFTQEIVSRAEGAPDPSAGVEDAQRYFDSRRADIEAKLRPLKDGGDAETRRKVLEQRTEAEMSVSKLRLRYVDHSTRDPAYKAKLDKLIGDYKGLIESMGDD